tara:strand:- start:6929 stop:7765 length:837 start_codon:yes stop_codon:yes gene_type:complete
MKNKHNKKRNSAFIYEALVREATVSILKKDTERQQKAIGLIKKYFCEGSVLKRDLDCYRSLYKTQNLDRFTTEKIIKEAKLTRMVINPQELFNKQTALIHDVNKKLSPEVFNNYVPNYKTLATIAQIFSHKASPKNQVILENEVAQKMMSAQKAQTENLTDIDNVVYRTFVQKFNDKYNGELLDEQKELLTRYIVSFVDNALDLKSYLNEEIARLKIALEEAKTSQEIKSDTDMVFKTDKVLNRLNEFSKQPLSDNLLLTVMKTQQLVREINTDGNRS